MIRRFALAVLAIAALVVCGCSPAATPHKLGAVGQYDQTTIKWSENSSAAATTTLVGSTRAGFIGYSSVSFEVKIVGATGGTVDVYLQKKIDTNTWADYAHFPQVAAGTTKFYNVSAAQYGSTIVNNGWGTDAAPGVVLAANAFINGHPGDVLRLVTVTGAGVTVAAAITIYAICRTAR